MGKQLNKLVKSLEKTQSKVIQVGHFETDGIRSGTTLTNPDLLRIWHLGAAKNNEGNVKSPLYQFIATNLSNHGIARNANVNSIVETWQKNVMEVNAENKLLNDVGEVLAEEYRDMFGKVAYPHMPLTNNNTTPMLDTQELKQKARYKVVVKNA